MGRRKERKEEFLPLSGPLFHRLLDETAALRMWGCPSGPLGTEMVLQQLNGVKLWCEFKNLSITHLSLQLMAGHCKTVSYLASEILELAGRPCTKNRRQKPSERPSLARHNYNWGSRWLDGRVGSLFCAPVVQHGPNHLPAGCLCRIWTSWQRNCVKSMMCKKQN